MVPVTARPIGVAGLQRGDALVHQLTAAVDEPRLFGAVLERAPGNLVVVLFVRLAEIRGVRVRNRALQPHQMKSGARVETAGNAMPTFWPAGTL
jgi:hypothetical protein